MSVIIPTTILDHHYENSCGSSIVKGLGAIISRHNIILDMEL